MSVKAPAVFKPLYLDAEDASANITGDWLFIEDFTNLGFQAVWTEDVDGTFLFEVSNDDKAPVVTPGVVAPSGRLGPSPLTLPDSMTVDAAIPAGTAGNFYFGFNQIEARWFRMSFVAGDGSGGTLSVGASLKGL